MRPAGLLLVLGAVVKHKHNNAAMGQGRTAISGLPLGARFYENSKNLVCGSPQSHFRARLCQM